MALEVMIERRLGQFYQNVAFSTEGGRAMGLLGASGSGKSLTLRTIAGIERPDRGRITLNGRVLFDSDQRIDLPPQKRRVGYLFQNYALFPTMTAKENIAVSLKDAAAGEEKVRQMIRRYRLEGLENHYPHQLSGGQQQRVALARLMMTDPEVILLDEPFSALDSFLKEQMIRELQEMLSDYPGDVIMVSHSRDDIYKTCPRLAVISDGQLLLEGETKAIFRNPRYIEACCLTGCKNISRARKTGEKTLYAEEWGMELEAAETVPDDLKAVGIRAHYIREVTPGVEGKSIAEGTPAIEGTPANTGLFRLESLLETPFEYHYRVIPENGNGALIWMVPKGPKDKPKEHFEGALCLPREDLMLLTDR